MEKLYFSIDEAREEIKKRQSNQELKSKVEEYLKNDLIPGLGDEPKAVIIRSIMSPDHGFEYFLFLSKYVGLRPLMSEYTEDKFVGLSEEKLGLARLHLIDNNGKKKLADIINFKEFHGLQIPQVRVLSGETLIEFHHNLFSINSNNIELTNISKYFKNFGRPKDYYPYYLANFIYHGVLFENFCLDKDTNEYAFTNDVVIPVMEDLERRFGCRPIVVRLYPEEQSNDEDFFWFSYSKQINNYIVEYAQKNNCIFKDLPN